MSGEMGQATKMKLVLNMLMGTMLAGLAETMALSEKIGLNTVQVLNILSHTVGSSALLRSKGTGKLDFLYPVVQIKQLVLPIAASKKTRDRVGQKKFCYLFLYHDVSCNYPTTQI